MSSSIARVPENGAWWNRFRREQLGPRMSVVPALTGRVFTTAPVADRGGETTTFTFLEAHAGQRIYRAWGRRLAVAGVYVHLSVETTFPHERLKLVQVARRFGRDRQDYPTSFVGMHAQRLARTGFHEPDAPHRGWFVDIESTENPYWDEYRYAGRTGRPGRPAELLDAPGVNDVPGGYEFWTVAISDWAGRRRIVGALWWGFEVASVRRYWLFRSHCTSVYQPHAQPAPPAEFFSALDRWDGAPIELDASPFPSRIAAASPDRNGSAAA